MLSLSSRDIQGMHYANPRRYPEVLFPKIFTNRQPWDINPNFPDNPLPATIPIFRLTHVTHDAEAQAISIADFTFIPRPKYGKSGRAGETYRFNGDYNCEEIRDTDRVFPGYLSWWGIDVQQWYTEYKEGRKLLDSIREERGISIYVPSYLAYPPESQYGNRAFSTSFSQILQDYHTARLGQIPCLKVGGTLHYRNEICYVIVVCTEEDNLEMPAVNTIYNPQFNPNGLVDQNGVVIDFQKTPEFNAASIIKSAIAGRDSSGKNEYAYFSWEQLVFAFYFPTQGFVCTDIDRSRVDHYQRICPKCWGNNQRLQQNF